MHYGLGYKITDVSLADNVLEYTQKFKFDKEKINNLEDYKMFTREVIFDDNKNIILMPNDKIFVTDKYSSNFAKYFYEETFGKKYDENSIVDEIKVKNSEQVSYDVDSENGIISITSKMNLPDSMNPKRI